MSTVLGCQREQQAQHGGVYMHVHVAVYMRQAQTCRGKALELSLQLARQLCPCRRTESVPQAGTPGFGGEDAIMVGDVWHLVRGQCSTTTSYYHMQSHGERWRLSRQRHGFVHSVASYHQAGTGEDALPVRVHDGLVDAVRSAKVVRIQDDLYHCTNQIVQPRLILSWAWASSLGVEGNAQNARTGVDTHDRCELGDVELAAVKPFFDFPSQFLGLLQCISVEDGDV